MSYSSLIRESEFVPFLYRCIACLDYSLFNHILIVVHQLVFFGGEGVIASNVVMNGFVYVSCTCMRVFLKEKFFEE